MSSPIVRCPYCVLGSEFRPMFRRSKFRRSKKFVCVACGHSALPDVPYSKCACPKCQAMNQITTRCRSVFESVQRAYPAATGK